MAIITREILEEIIREQLGTNIYNSEEELYNDVIQCLEPDDVYFVGLQSTTEIPETTIRYLIKKIWKEYNIEK